ncbi:MAG: pyridoxal phosphate-dependent aminotransferase [Acidobacteriota bacterium]
MEVLSPAASPHASETLQAFRAVPRTGVIYVTNEARKRGFGPGATDWVNLGQGQPEIGPLPGAPPRHSAITIEDDDHEYAPIGGIADLRAAVAELYNRLYRRGMPSQYTAENVAISGGGRGALTRAVAALGSINLGHFLPDYTAYEELLDIFRLVTPIPILLSRERAYRFTAEDLQREILGRGLSAILLSNPCNPLGKLISGQELADWVATARRLDCTLMLDEFYSHYIWQAAVGEPGPTVSAARYVEDVDEDPVVLVDGLTKNWRYPGWRVTWTVGPKRVIEAVTSAGSFLDGGGAKPMQRAAAALVNEEHVLAESQAIRDAFLPKRRIMLDAIERMGLRVERAPEATFYAFAALDGLPQALTDGMAFFRAALDHKVICVPGVFFDVNPGHRRARRLSRFQQYVRLSFGPPQAQIEQGLARLQTMIDAAR